MNALHSEMNGSPTQLRTLLILFIILRLILLFFYFPQGLFSAFTDFYYYFQTAQLSEQGFYPFVNMWYEYPPVLAYLPQLAYWLADHILPMTDIYSFGFQLYYRILGVILLLFDVGVLVLIHRIASRAWGQSQANWVAWVYAFLGLPLLFSTYSHQVVPLFFWLLVVDCFLSFEGNKIPSRSWLTSAIALGLGITAKFTPGILLAPVIKFLWPQKRRIVWYGLATLITVALVYLPFFLLGGKDWISASFKALDRVGSYGTLWAAIDGNWGPGSYGPLERRLELDLAEVALARPAVIPGILKLGLFAGLYALVFIRSLDNLVDKQPNPARQFIWFSTLTSIFFHLWSKGWSPQWAVMIVPLLLLCFPDLRGLRWVLILTGLVLLEWAVTSISLSPTVITLFAILRTAFFVTTALVLFRQLWPNKRLTKNHIDSQSSACV